MQKVKARLDSSNYEIYIGSGIRSRLGYWLKQDRSNDKLVIVTHPAVMKLYGEALEEDLSRQGFRVAVLLVPEGEEQKSLETAGRLYSELADFRAERTTPILALGGGVIGDLAGFVAATYLRGVPLVQIPTTLLAQVDSSIGGKVAVDHDRLKNKIGAFYQPRLVVSDISTLSTLSSQELNDGLAEIIKYAVIRDKNFFSYLEQNMDRIRSPDSSSLEEVVFRCTRIKVRIVEKDERDLGIRNILNFGHTAGHALEAVSDFSVRHGQAVAMGMIIAARISSRLGRFPGKEHVRLMHLIQKAGLPTKIPDLNINSIIDAMEHDKKVLRGRIRFILPESIGKVFIDEVTPALIEEVLSSCYEDTQNLCRHSRQ